MIAAIHQPNYLPWLGYFYKILKSDVFIILDDAQYPMRSYVHRTQVKTPTGPQWLTVPVLTKGHLGQRINQVHTNPTVFWQSSHLKALRLNYSRCAHSGYLLPFLEEIYAEKWSRLVDLNVKLVRGICGLLGIKTSVLLSSELGCSATGTERIVELCKAVKASTYLSGSGGRNYQDEQLFQNAGVELRYSDFVHPKYVQQWGEFTAGLSIIDLLLNCGPASFEILQSASAIK